MESINEVLLLYSSNFLALLDEQDAYLTSCGLALANIGSPLNPAIPVIYIFINL
tara:strand:+ start:426 stop:587 length:162 start_codon:yes stop_codon:yes gene_type:complete